MNDIIIPILVPTIAALLAALVTAYVQIRTEQIKSEHSEQTTQHPKRKSQHPNRTIKSELQKINWWITLLVTFLVGSVTVFFVYRSIFMTDTNCSSSSFQSDYTNCWRCTCGKAFDNNLDTRWASQWSDNEWIIRDLGTPKLIDTVVLQWELAYGKAYTIDVSTDELSWTTVYTQTNGKGGVETITFPPVVAQYVRMKGISRGTKYDTPDGRPFGYSLWEFQIYQTGNIVK
jgi:F5/8 type C domain